MARPPAKPPAAALLLHAAWMAIGLGLLIQVLLLATGSAGTEGAQGTIAELGGKVSWSAVVCGGVALGMTAAKLRSAAMGLLGLFFAPVAFWTAKTVQKSLGAALGAAGADTAAGLSAAGVAAVKSIEYAALGALIGWISTRPWGTMKVHAAAGLLVGLLTAVAVGSLSAAAGTPLTGVKLAALAINEVLFPAGCAVVLYASRVLANRLKPEPPPPPTA